MPNNLENAIAPIQGQIHPTAIIDPQAHIHPSVTVGPYCVITGPVIIEAGTILESHVRIQGPVTIGMGNRIYSFSSLGCDPQDKKYQHELTSLVIGDFNIIREYATLSRGTGHGGGITRIGSHNLLMAYVHVAHDCIIANHNILANNASLAGHVEVGSYVGLGGFSGVHQFVRIGSYSFSGGGSIITKDIPPYTLIAGHPAKLIGLNLEGLKRQGFTEEQKKTLKDFFKTLFRNSEHILSTAQALLDSLTTEQEVAKPLLMFILSSIRGITR